MTVPMHRFLAAALLLAGAAQAVQADRADEQRAPSTQELASFQAFVQKRFPEGPAPAPQWRITRADAGAPWRVEARVLRNPVRGLRTLCRAERIDASLAKSWSAAAPRTVAWLEPGACAHGDNAVELAQRMPDSDVLALLERQGALLANARLVMAGNSACAVARSYPFTLAALDVGEPGPTHEQMAALVYRGGITGAPAEVRVWMRRAGAALDLWTVSCPAR
ncbi:MAG: hypothetical protein ACLGI6_08585 [Gammaproteobacteria bacterium]